MLNTTHIPRPKTREDSTISVWDHCRSGVAGDSRIKCFRSRITFKTLLMEISNQLRCLFSATVKEQGGSYVVEVPKQEIQLGDIQASETYRVAVLPSASNDEVTDTSTKPERERGPPKPPVSEGEHRTVEIEDIGDKGDGLARVERGFVVIIPDTEQGERVTIEITQVRENVCFAEVVERVSYYE